MKISLIIPDVNACPTDRPRACRYCKEPYLHGHGTLTKPIRDHKLKEVIVRRYKCVSCAKTFRHYPVGITNKDQSRRAVVLAALMYGLGLSCSAASHLLEALGVEVSKVTVWRDAQEAGEALRKRRCPAGRVVVRVLGADETIFKVKGREVVLGFVIDGQSGRTLGFEVLFEGNGEAFKEWLEPYAKELKAEVLISDDNDSYSVATAELGLSHQLCIAHVRKYLKRRSKSILEQAKGEWGEQDEKYEKLEEDLDRLRGLLDALAEEGGKLIGQMHREYLWAQPLRRKHKEGEAKKEKAGAGYRMRMLTLELWRKWPKILLYLRRPELGLDGTNNASERSIGRSKVRYKTMRGYKSVEGMSNGVVLTHWLYSGEDEHHDLAEEMAA
jgi:transposase-like protein